MTDAIQTSLQDLENKDLDTLNTQLADLKGKLANNGGAITDKVDALCLTMEYLRRTTHQPYKDSLSDADGQPIQLGQELNTTQVMCNLLMLQAKEKPTSKSVPVVVNHASVLCLQSSKHCKAIVSMWPHPMRIYRRAFREYRPLIESMGLSVGVGIDLYAQGSGSMFCRCQYVKKSACAKASSRRSAHIKGEKVSGG